MREVKRTFLIRNFYRTFFTYQGAFTIDKCPELDDKKTILTIERTKEIFQELIGEHWAEEAFRFYAHRAKISAQKEASLEELRFVPEQNNLAFFTKTFPDF